jgi:hypothetical protein
MISSRIALSRDPEQRQIYRDPGSTIRLFILLFVFALFVLLMLKQVWQNTEHLLPSFVIFFALNYFNHCLYETFVSAIKQNMLGRETCQE